VVGDQSGWLVDISVEGMIVSIGSPCCVVISGVFGLRHWKKMFIGGRDMVCLYIMLKLLVRRL